MAADALSRVGHLMSVQMVTQVQPLWIQEVINSYATDAFAQELLAQLAVHSPNEDGFSLHQGVIRKEGLIWIAHNSALKTKLISALRDSAVGDTLGGKLLITGLKGSFGGRG